MKAIINKLGFLKKTVTIQWNVRGLENPNIVDIKAVIIKYQKASLKLSITIRKTVKVGAHSPLCSEQKSENIFIEKM